jgi:hypothetical protein
LLAFAAGCAPSVPSPGPGPAGPQFAVGRDDPERRNEEWQVLHWEKSLGDLLGECDGHSQMVARDLRDGRTVFAMDWASKATDELARAEEALDTLMREHREVTRIPAEAWVGGWPPDLTQAHRAAFRQLPWLRLELARYQIFRRESYLKLSPEELVLHYSMDHFAPALKHIGPVIKLDFPAELRQRAVAAKALRERVSDPEKFRKFADNSSGGPKGWESRIMSMASWVVGYEVVLAESNWLLVRAPEAARPECAKIAAEIAAGLPEVRRTFDALQADPDKNVREKAVSWLQFHRDFTALYQLRFLKSSSCQGLADPG